MADPIRIKDVATAATTLAADDYVVVDGATNGTRKAAPSDSGKAVLMGTPAEGREALGIAGDASNAMVAPYFVDSVGGNDTNSGRTASAPLKTFSALVAKGIVSGDRIFLKRGSYFREALDLGSVDNLTISAYGQGTLPVIDGSDNLTNASFTANGTYSGVYDLAFTTPTIADPRIFIVWESSAALGYDVQLQPFTTLAALNGSATGGFYAQGTTLYVKATDGSDVRSNGRTYSAHAARSYPIRTRHNCEVSWLRILKPFNNDGLWLGRNCWMHDCTLEYGGKHHAVVGGGLYQRNEFRYIANSNWISTTSSCLGFYYNGAGFEDYVVEDCVFKNEFQNAGVTAFTQHADGGGTYRKCTVRRNSFERMSGIFGNPPFNLVFEDNRCEDVVAPVDTASTSGCVVSAARNAFLFKAITGTNSCYKISAGNVFSLRNDSIRCTGGTAAQYLTCGNNASGWTCEITGCDSNRGTTSTVGFVYIPAVTAGGALTVKGCKFRDRRVLDANAATPTLTTLAFDYNEYVPQSLWIFNGATSTGFAAWKAASSQDAASAVIPELLPPQQQDVVFGATASLALLNKYLTISGALVTDRVTLRWVGTGPTQWLVIPQITSPTALYLACRNCSSSTTTETTYTLVIQLMRGD